MKVSELPYKRVTIEEIRSVMEDVIRRTREASCTEEILEAREQYLELYKTFATASSLSYMRYSINTVDEFYVAEKDYYDEIGPEVNNYMVEYARPSAPSWRKSSPRCSSARWRSAARPCRPRSSPT